MNRLVLAALIAALVAPATALARGHRGGTSFSSHHASSSASKRSSGTHAGSHGSTHASTATRDGHGRIKRSKAVRDAFMRDHPCPSTGKRSGACPGYVVDHVRPLKRGGADHPSNMQWQSKEDAKAKDRWE